MGRIDQSIIEEIRNRNPIEDVVSQYVSLKRAGSYYSGLCPFHSEKTPSFVVYPGTKSFFCFGCHVGGDVITFVKRVENVSYSDALKILAQRAGITLPEYHSEEHGVSRQRIFDMNKSAARYFYNQFCNSDEAKAYASERGLSPATVKHFGLGYAPDGFELINVLKKEGYTEEEMIAGFLCAKSSKTDGIYPIYRNRLMFPIFDISQNVIAFGGRIIGDGKPKYLNSSDTPVFKKKYNLYALNYAKNYCSDRMILCEGYMDVIAMHAAGFTNAVATLGTAITEEHARLMKRYTKSVVISYDNDQAGQDAAEKAFQLFEKVDLDAKILKMTGAKDPDEFIKKNGKEAFSKLLDGSISRFENLFLSIQKKYDITSPDGIISAAEEIGTYISTIYSSVERELYIRNACERFGISKDSLIHDVERKRKRLVNEAKKAENTNNINASRGFGDKVKPEAVRNLGKNYAEDVIIGIMLTKYEYIDKIKSGEIELSSEDLVSEFAKKVFKEILESSEVGTDFDIALLGPILNDDEYSRCYELKIKREQLDNSDKVFMDCVNKLKEKKNKSLEEILHEKRNR